MTMAGAEAAMAVGVGADGAAEVDGAVEMAAEDGAAVVTVAVEFRCLRAEQT
jgi:L-asparaginase/Glu-tRNA(Gln) amidotransferase subunit D